MPKLKPTCPRKPPPRTFGPGVRGVSPLGGKVEEIWRKRFVKKMSFESGVEVRRSNGWKWMHWTTGSHVQCEEYRRNVLGYSTSTKQYGPRCFHISAPVICIRSHVRTKDIGREQFTRGLKTSVCALLLVRGVSVDVCWMASTNGLIEW